MKSNANCFFYLSLHAASLLSRVLWAGCTSVVSKINVKTREYLTVIVQTILNVKRATSNLKKTVEHKKGCFKIQIRNNHL